MKRFFLSGIGACAALLIAVPAAAKSPNGPTPNGEAPAPQLEYDFGKAAFMAEAGPLQPCEGLARVAANGSGFFIYAVVCQAVPVTQSMDPQWLRRLAWT